MIASHDQFGLLQAFCPWYVRGWLCSNAAPLLTPLPCAALRRMPAFPDMVGLLPGWPALTLNPNTNPNLAGCLPSLTWWACCLPSARWSSRRRLSKPRRPSASRGSPCQRSQSVWTCGGWDSECVSAWDPCQSVLRWGGWDSESVLTRSLRGRDAVCCSGVCASVVLFLWLRYSLNDREMWE